MELMVRKYVPDYFAIDGNVRLEVWRDTDAEDPRKWDELGRMICWHSRYRLGDKHSYSSPDDFLGRLYAEQDCRYDPDSVESEELTREEIIGKLEKRGVIMLPLYLFDHSGISMSTSSSTYRMMDGAGWDWRQVGVIYATSESIRKFFDRKRVTKKLKDNARKALIEEVKTYSFYLEGEVYGYKLFVDGEEADSCWGFYTDEPGKSYMREHISGKYRYLLDSLEFNDGGRDFDI